MSEADPWQHRTAGMRCATCMWYAVKVKDIPGHVSGRIVEMDASTGVQVGPKSIAGIAEAIGRCRRHAPTMNGYPVVYQTDWCGDHKIDENKIG